MHNNSSGSKMVYEPICWNEQVNLLNNFDSDVVLESNQIQDLLMPRNNSSPNSPWERNLAKIH